jgi:hypothetical protein
MRFKLSSYGTAEIALVALLSTPVQALKIRYRTMVP